MRHKTLAASMAALVGAAPAWAQSGAPVEQGPPNVPAFAPAFAEQTRAPASDSGVSLAVETVAEGLEHPWGIAVTPTGELIVSERPGRLRVISPRARSRPRSAACPRCMR